MKLTPDQEAVREAKWSWADDGEALDYIDDVVAIDKKYFEEN